MVDVLLGLEAVLVGDVGYGVDEPVGRGVPVAALHRDGAVVLAHLLQRALLLPGDAVAGLVSIRRDWEFIFT